MHRIFVALTCLCLASEASAQSVGEKMRVNSSLEISPSTADFVKQVAISDMFEIQSNKLAQKKGTAEGEAFAAQMVTDHTKTGTELKALVASGKAAAEVPTALDGSHQNKLDSGSDFVSSYRSMQVDAHKEAVDLFERYARGGDNVRLKSWAFKTLPALKRHLQMAQGLERQDSR
jgi:putative membrane protein